VHLEHQQIEQLLYLLCAILRSCLFFGVSHVFTGKKQHCPLNSTVSKTSAGAAELIQTHLVENSKLFVEKWKK
jgi:tRNA G18 (ribose-2'-O)-methylase SpoU